MGPGVPCPWGVPVSLEKSLTDDPPPPAIFAKSRCFWDQKNAGFFQRLQLGVGLGDQTFLVKYAIGTWRIHAGTFFCIFYLRIYLRIINHSCRHTCRSSHGSYGILIATKHVNIFTYIYIYVCIYDIMIYIYISQCQGFIYFTVYDVGEFICHFETWDSY